MRPNQLRPQTAADASLRRIFGLGHRPAPYGWPPERDDSLTVA